MKGRKFRRFMKMHDSNPYFHENEKRDFYTNSEAGRWEMHDSIYDTASDYEQQTIFQFNLMEIDEKLDHLKNAIKVSIRITNYEIFKIGELLLMAKKVCREKGISFQEWIFKNFDFSYETANNFMNVFKNCFGHREMALRIPTSILYRLGSPNFPEQLREYLFANGNMEEWSNGKFINITQKYKEGGIEAIEADIEEINRSELVYRQCNYSIDLCESALRTLKELKSQIRNRTEDKTIIEFEVGVKQDQPESYEVNTGLHEAIDISSGILNDALTEARRKMDELHKNILNRL